MSTSTLTRGWFLPAAPTYAVTHRDIPLGCMCVWKPVTLHRGRDTRTGWKLTLVHHACRTHAGPEGLT